MRTGSSQHRLKYLREYSVNQLFATVVKVKMFGNYWFNAQDGYFYQVAPNDDLIKEQKNKYIGYRQALQFVYRNMQVGYNIRGDKICYRKNCYSKKYNPLLFCSKLGKKRN